MKILHLDSSVTGEKSVSRPLTKLAAEALKAKHPDAEYTYRDLIDKPIRHYTAVVRMFGAEATGLNAEQQEELATGKEILEEFLASDVVLIGAPMYNFNIPSQLKAWIDHICVAGKTFQYGANGPEGLCGGKKIVVLSSRGGKYGPGSPYEPFDHQATYLKHLFTFLGVKDITVIQAEGIGMGPDAVLAANESAKAEIAKL